MRPWPLALAIALAVGAIGIDRSAAQDFPSRPVTIVIPFPPGGAFDATGRIIAERMRLALGQPVIIENVGGAAGNIGVARVARAAPDGYTLSYGIWSTHVINAAIYPLGYDVVKDFAPIALLATSPQVIVSSNAVPAKDLRGLIAWLKADPGRATLATVGPGSPPHVAGLLLEQLTQTRVRFVPYRGGAPAAQDLLSGQVDLSILQPAVVLPYVRAGKLRAYAVAAAARLTAAPEIPSADEAGVPGLHVSTWSSLWAPKGTPKEIVMKLNAAVTEALADADVRKRLAEIGQEIPPRAQQTPQALAALQLAEIAKWWPIIRAAHVEAQ
ncbi:MAG TPA: tripartite tricarboxylate transporter substrate-binding protein [Xanthobacteraceae bacterium]|jgi:tripartite-type tricarboxylate transporter receptor subunit TctC